MLRSPAVSSPVAAATPSRRSSKRRADSLVSTLWNVRSVWWLSATSRRQKVLSPFLPLFLSLSDDHIAANVSKLGVLLGDNDSLVRHAVRQIKVLEHGSLIISPVGKNKIKRDLSKDLDEACVDDGFENLMLNNLNSNMLEDVVD